MNHIYKVVRCKRTGVFKAVPENAKSKINHKHYIASFVQQ